MPEIQVARSSPVPQDGNWRTGIIQEDSGIARQVTAEERAERDKRIAEMWLSKKTMAHIQEALGLTPGQLQASLDRQNLRWRGGAGKNSGWRMQNARSQARSKKQGEKVHEGI